MKKSLSVVGVMSGTSMDGVDMAYVQFDKSEAGLGWKLIDSHSAGFDDEWTTNLSAAKGLEPSALFALDRAYGTYIGSLVQDWLTEQQLPVPTAIASHSYTVDHSPDKGYSYQIGHGATMAAASGLPVVTDFRSGDIAYKGQGAPFAPFGDQVLFPGYKGYLNLGGIANLHLPNDALGIDLTGCNLLMNALAQERGLAYDKDGQLSAGGRPQPDLLEALWSWRYHLEQPPKSLEAQTVMNNLWPPLAAHSSQIADKLHTVAALVGRALKSVTQGRMLASSDLLLITGGGAHHPVVRQQVEEAWPGQVVLPDPVLIDQKEAILFAYFGAMRWWQLPYSLPRLTGARQPTCGGAVYLP